MARGVASLLLAAVALAAARAPETDAAPAAPCAAPRVGLLAPLTGEAAFLGKEQLGFARYAARTVGARRVRVAEADTQLDPARAGQAAKTLLANPDVLALVGPASSSEVLAVARVFRGELAFISPSALAAPLTNGSLRSFFRVVPSERAQAGAVVRVLRSILKARRVAIVDDRSSYSRGLASRVGARLQRAGIAVARDSVDRRTTDFADVVAAIRADAVFLPWQIAANAQAFGEELRAQGKGAVVVGSDAVDSRDFVLEGSFVTSFAPDVRALPGNDAFVAGYGRGFSSRFGPPAYVAAQAAILAIRRACADGDATRTEVLRQLRATNIRRTVLGGPLRFTPGGDRKGAAFSVFRLGPGGRRTLVG